MARSETKADDLFLVVRMREMVSGGKAAEAREAARLSQAEVAGAVGVSRSAVCLWETGARTPRGAHALKYAKLLDRLTRAAV